MPTKVKTNPLGVGNAGFLRPTLSSLSKAIDKNENKKTRGGLIKGGFRELPVGVLGDGIKTPPMDDAVHIPISGSESPLHSESRKKSVASSAKHEILFLSCSPRIHTQDAGDEDPASLKMELVSENERKIEEAREVCEELRHQIENLKLQQRQFESRIIDDLAEEGNDDKVNVDNGEGHPYLNSEIVTKNDIGCLDCDSQGIPRLKVTENANIQSVKHIASFKNPKPIKPTDPNSEDSFTLHGSVTSSDFQDISLKEEWLRTSSKEAPPKKVIKRLYSERERYKRKVRQLQVALHKLKKEKMLSASRSPDMAAHDVVYFNADLIGEGHLSFVYAGTINNNSQKVAVKKLVRPDMMSTSDRSYLAAEAGLLMTLHHRNIVQVFAVCTAPLQPLIVTELVSGRNLHDKLHSVPGWRLSSSEYYSVARDVSVGMAYLHGQKPPVLHLNLRPCNIMVEASGHAKVSDFGFSKIRLDAGVSNRANFSYLAPELLQFPVHMTTKLDVYSFAVMLWEMATSQIPYVDMSTSEILAYVSNGKRLNIPSDFPSGFHALISRCWDQSALQRPSFKELIILLETMALPSDWTESIVRSGVSRTDTTGLITPRDDKSFIAVDGKMKSLTSSQQRITSRQDEERRKLSKQFALESDMISMGYVLSKHEENSSNNVLHGFRPNYYLSRSRDRYPTDARIGSRAVNLSTRLYPREIVPHANYAFTKDPNLYKTVELNQTHRVSETSKFKTNERQMTSQNDSKIVSEENVPSASDTSVIAEENCGCQRRTGEKDCKRSQMTRDDDMHVPQPLTDTDLRYVKQNLKVGTPKVFTERNGSNLMVPSSSFMSQEDLKMAVSIPYLKNRHSSDGSSSNIENTPIRSPFDEKLSTYVSDACQAESRNYVDSRLSGWHSARSNLMPPSDHVKVHSIRTSAADRIFNENHKKTSKYPSTAWTESSESLMTAIYHPTEAQRRSLDPGYFQNSKATGAQDDLISLTPSEKSLDETGRIGIISIPSSNTTLDKKISVPSKPARKSHPKHVFRQGPASRTGQNSSWNKLKNSYSPEPLIATPAFGSFELRQISPQTTMIPLPPALRRSERSSSFSRVMPKHQPLVTNEENGKRRKKRSDERNEKSNKRRNDTMNKIPTDCKIANAIQTSSNSTLDEVENSLNETADDLNALSNMLENAAEKRKQDRKGHR